MKRTFLFAILAAAIAPLPAAAQLNPEGAPGPEQTANYKYEVYVGAAYSRVRQVPETYSGLIGGKMTVGRDWGRYFQLAGSADYYSKGTGHAGLPNPGHPTIYTALAAPTVHATLYGNVSGEFFGELGAEHTGGENMSPNLSFAGGFGGGLTYSLNQKFAVQLTGDRVAASFPLPGSNSQNGYSTHKTWNARATIGVVYRF